MIIDSIRLLEIGKQLSTEKNTLTLLELILNACIEMTLADAGTIYLIIDPKTQKWTSIQDGLYEDKLLKFVVSKNHSIIANLEEAASTVSLKSISGYTVIKKSALIIENAYNIDPKLEYTHNSNFDFLTGYITKSILCVPMKDHKENVIGVIQLINKKKFPKKINYQNKNELEDIISFDENDQLIITSLCGQASIVLENNLLYNDMKQLLNNYKKQNKKLTFLSKKILIAHEEERKRIAREIHDGAAQSVANIGVRLEILNKFYERNDIESFFNELKNLKVTTKSTLKDIRNVIYDLKPSYLDNGIIEALKDYIGVFKNNTGINVSLDINGDDKEIEYYISSAIFRIMQELLANINKHAKAKNVYIKFIANDEEIKICVKDDGIGFDIKKRHNKVYSGFGLSGIKERLEIINGSVDIVSGSEGTGVKVRILNQVGGKN